MPPFRKRLNSAIRQFSTLALNKESENSLSVLPDHQIRRVGLLYSAYRFIMSVFLFISGYAININNEQVTVKLPTLLQQTTLVFYGLFSLLALAFLLAIRKNYRSQYLAGLVMDLLFLSIFLYLNGIANIQVTLLYMVVVAVSFMILNSYQAFIITMLAVIVVIYQQFFQVLIHDLNFKKIGDVILQSLCFITVGFLSWSVTQRLVKVEQLAIKNAEEINKLNTITQEVISKMSQGVLVLNERKNILLSNHSANQMLSIVVKKTALKTKKKYATNTVLKKNRLNNNANANANANANNDEKNVLTDSLEKSNSLYISPNQTIEEQISKNHPELIIWINETSTYSKSQLIYQLPIPNATYDKIRLSTTPMHDGIILVMIDDLRREQTNAQQMKLASLGQLTASIAHEIRNPLGAISQASQLLMDDIEWNDTVVSDVNDSTEPDQNIELYEMIYNQTKRVNRIIEDVLKLSRQERPEQEKLDLVTWLPQFIDNHYRDHDIFFHPKCEPSIYFDQNQLEQILINLVSNGLRFSSKSHPHAYVEIEICCIDNDVIIDILDSGTGVSKDKIENLFMPFFTTDNEGTGLGLYLSQAFAEANYARLMYEPTHEKTCFRLIAPKPL